MNKKWLWALVPALVVPILVSGCANGGGTILPDIATEEPSSLSLSLDSQQRGIWVNGEGKTPAVPDIAILRLGIEVQEESVAQAQAEATEAMESVMAALEENGVAENDIQTQFFNIWQVTRWDDQNQREIVIGYRVSNIVSAKIRDVEQTGVIIDAVALAGGDFTRINGISFTVDDPTPYYEIAREEAMADARAKAEQLASLAGVRLGKPVYITEGTLFIPPVYPRGGFDESFAAAAPTPISPGELEIGINVQVAYDIID